MEKIRTPSERIKEAVQNDLTKGTYTTVIEFMRIFNEYTKTAEKDTIFNPEILGFVQIDIGNPLEGTIQRVQLQHTSWGKPPIISLSIREVNIEEYAVSDALEYMSFPVNDERRTVLFGSSLNSTDGGDLECTQDAFEKKVIDVLDSIPNGTVRLVFAANR